MLTSRCILDQHPWRLCSGYKFYKPIYLTFSGGVNREWAGVPRQYFQPGKKDPRCACVKDTGPPSGAKKGAKHNNRGDLDNPLMKLYEGCDPKSFECRFKEWEIAKDCFQLCLKITMSSNSMLPTCYQLIKCKITTLNY